jgi:hypothetical protein
MIAEHLRKGVHVDEQLEYGFGTAVFVLDYTSGKIKPEEAERAFGEVTKENFWRMWPGVKQWAETVWQIIEDERGDMARPVEDEELDEVGGGG